MNTLTRNCLLPLLMFAAMCAAYGDTPVPSKPQTTAKAEGTTQVAPAQSGCVNYCNAAESRCSSEVRRARAECSKRAANAGRDPFTMRNNDYTYFCGYFGNNNACGSGSYSAACRSRFSRTYGLCIDAVQQNIASMRYDCFLTERTAQNYCRDELRDCKAQCQ
ncbi:MAG TPA: hypothetical protein VKB34_20755 [Povalibacter sp.]|nr:hypothetical protein [Povalibacter sp.]